MLPYHVVTTLYRLAAAAFSLGTWAALYAMIR